MDKSSRAQASRERIERFVAAVRWQFAKTMRDIPHWYTMLQWAPELRAEFMYFVNCIHEHGYNEAFQGKTYRYLDVGEYKYWTVDPSPEETNLINRARLDGHGAIPSAP